jgi:hypothetical protein
METEALVVSTLPNPLPCGSRFSIGEVFVDVEHDVCSGYFLRASLGRHSFLLTIFPKMVSPLLLDIFGPKIIVNFRIFSDVLNCHQIEEIVAKREIKLEFKMKFFKLNRRSTI